MGFTLSNTKGFWTKWRPWEKKILTTESSQSSVFDTSGVKKWEDSEGCKWTSSLGNSRCSLYRGLRSMKTDKGGGNEIKSDGFKEWTWSFCHSWTRKWYCERPEVDGITTVSVLRLLSSTETIYGFPHKRVGWLRFEESYRLSREVLD